MLKILKLSDIQRRVDVAYSGEQALRLLRENIRHEEDEVRYSRLNKSGDDDVNNNNYLDIVSEEDQEFRPDMKYVCDYGVVFTDCSMPFMDGYECA